jgi:ABC-type sugar transport system permease subunit
MNVPLTPAADATPGQSLGQQIRRHWPFYLFVSPFFLSFAVFGLWPLLFSFYLSFVAWDGLTTPRWVGLANYQTLAGDAIFRATIWNTVVLFVLYVPIMLLGAFVFAVLLNGPVTRARGFFRAALFIPCITPMVVVAIVFGLMYGFEKGILNWMIRSTAGLFALETAGVPWRESEQVSKISVAILLVWRWTGYNMILMLAGLQGIPHEVYEAARIDGASRWQTLLRITLPLMRPTFLFCAITSLLGTVYMFDEIFVLTGGGPGTSSLNIGVYLFQTSFNDFKFGYASAMAYTVASVVFALTMLVWWRNQRREAA